MSDRVDELLSEWEEQYERGCRLTPEELCVDQPELLPEVRSQIAALLAIEANFGGLFGDKSADAGSDSHAQRLSQSWRVTSEFKLLGLHASGGLGDVYRAQDPIIDRQVAIKFPRRSQLTTHQLARFEREARITGQLDHPGIVAVHSLQHSETTEPFYVMRFVQGPTLHERVRTHWENTANSPGQRPFTSVAFRELLQQFVALCNIVAYAHDRGVIHRDIKPSNVILGPYGETFLMDWGLALRLGESESDARLEADPCLESRAVTRGDDSPARDGAEPEKEAALAPQEECDQGETARPPSETDHAVPTPATSGRDPRFTHSGQFLGTPAFAAPEQMLGQVGLTDRRADIYALGGTLFFLIAGQPPIQDAGGLEHRQSLRQGKLSLTTFPDSTPRALQAICRRALMVDPADRYTSALALAADVRQFLADEPISAMADPWSHKITRLLRRNRTLALTIASSLLLLTSIAMFATFWVAGLNRRLVAINADLEQTNTSLVESQRREEQARGLAEQNFDAAQGAVQQYLISIDDSEKLDQADFSELKRELLTSAKPFLERLRDQPTADAGVQRSRIEAAFRLALIEQETGNLHESISEYERCIEMVQEALRREPDNLELVYRLGRCYCNLANGFRRQGNIERTKQLSRSAIELANNYLEQRPKELRMLELLNVALVELGSTLHQHNEQPEANDVLRQAIESGRTHYDLDPKSEKASENLAMAHEQLGFVLRAEGKRELSLEHRQQAMALRQELVERFPQRTRYRTLLGMSCLNLGVMLAETGQQELARETYLKGLDIHQRLAADFPSNPMHLEHVAKSLNNLGNIAPAEGPGPTPEEYLRQAIQIHEQLAERFKDDPNQPVSLGGAYCNLGNYQMRADPILAIATYDRAEEILKVVEQRNPDLVALRSNLRNVYGGRASAQGMVYQPTAAQNDWLKAAEYDEGPNREFFNQQAVEAGVKAQKVTQFEAAIETGLDTTDPQAQAEFAEFCSARKMYVLALETFQQAFTEQPDLVREFGDNAALAALAVANESVEGAELPEDLGADLQADQRREWRGLALVWLSQQLDSTADDPGRKQRLRQWLRHPQLIGLRTPAANSDLNATEIDAWTKFWTNVDAALQVDGRRK